MSSPNDKLPTKAPLERIITNDQGITRSPTYKIKTPPPKPKKK